MCRSHLIIGILCELALAHRSLTDTEEHFTNGVAHKGNLGLSLLLSKVCANLIPSHTDFALLSSFRFQYIYRPSIK